MVTYTATVQRINRASQGPNGRMRTLSLICIKRAGALIATRTVPGFWTEKDALREYARFPGLFKALPKDVA